MNLAEEIQKLLHRAKDLDEYFNPHLIAPILEGLENVGIEDESLKLWCNEMWER